MLSNMLTTTQEAANITWRSTEPRVVAMESAAQLGYGGNEPNQHSWRTE